MKRLLVVSTLAVVVATVGQAGAQQRRGPSYQPAPGYAYSPDYRNPRYGHQYSQPQGSGTI